MMERLSVRRPSPFPRGPARLPHVGLMLPALDAVAPTLLKDRAPTLTRARAFRASRGPVLQREEAPRGLTPGAEG